MLWRLLLYMNQVWMSGVTWHTPALLLCSFTKQGMQDISVRVFLSRETLGYWPSLRMRKCTSITLNQWRRALKSRHRKGHGTRHQERWVFLLPPLWKFVETCQTCCWQAHLLCMVSTVFWRICCVGHCTLHTAIAATDSYLVCPLTLACLIST